MTAADLIQMLRKAAPTDVVKIFDPNSQQMEEVTGMLYGGSDGVTELCSDDPDDGGDRIWNEK